MCPYVLAESEAIADQLLGLVSIELIEAIDHGLVIHLVETEVLNKCLTEAKVRVALFSFKPLQEQRVRCQLQRVWLVLGRVLELGCCLHGISPSCVRRFGCVW